MGFAVQMITLFLLIHFVRLHYLPATALAVEAAILNNFFWHEKWTWVDRAVAGREGRFRRLVSFHLANGIISITGNVLMMRFLVGALDMHYVPATIIAITVCAVLNFIAGDRLVFRPYRESAPDGE